MAYDHLGRPRCRLQGRYEQQRIWLWLVIAHLWAGRLVAGAKHGLPYRRVDFVYSGRALRGKLLTKETALARAAGEDRLVSLDTYPRGRSRDRWNSSPLSSG